MHAPVVQFIALATAITLQLGCPMEAEPELVVSDGAVVELRDSVNGDVECYHSVLVVESGSTINGDIYAQGCNLKVYEGNNGDIVARGGQIVVVDSPTSVNGSMDIEGVKFVSVYASQFNGGFDIRRAHEIEIFDSHFNGDGWIDGAASALVFDASLNGDLAIRNVGDCVESGTDPNGSISAPGCQRP